MAALESGDVQKAEKFAKDLQSSAEEYTRNPRSRIAATSFGVESFATQTSNTILGLLALRRNEIENAKDHLIASATFEGQAAPVLVSFGPHMELARRLLEKGERETVLEYFEICSKFWKADRGRLARWTNAIRNGEAPDIGRADGTSLRVWRYGTL